ncbi:DUF1642 domain-containing protein [Streptococcus suis]|nr:DUF1642 domain-containing protein [Streptococcus suis]MBO4130971.1 DUF1642 domain-containing protein [Streptococcus suis]MBO4133673.1 DUF1642 domain-containing protein [Streptococcus suis]NQK17070.1 DUF1642 domain-containing protein [Streptococcus suis]NQM24359.1 DUF1642 domain-containing protein [Streptococcus suis]HEM3555566.1 DUF1642 domain-containing protein [Streptococcus suis]
MNKQELEKQAEALYADVRSFLDNTFELIDQIHEPQKVVVPQVAVEYYYTYKDCYYSLGELLSDFYSDSAREEFPRLDELATWLHDNDLATNRQRELALATLIVNGPDAVEVEQEQLYTVEIPNNGGTLILACINHAIKLVDGNKHLPGKFTKESIEYAGFDWALKWAKPAEVE